MIFKKEKKETQGAEATRTTGRKDGGEAEE